MRHVAVRLLRLIDLEPRVGYCAQAIGFILLQTPAEQASHGLGRFWGKTPPIGVLRGPSGPDLASRRPPDRGAARQPPERQAAESPQRRSACHHSPPSAAG